MIHLPLSMQGGRKYAKLVTALPSPLGGLLSIMNDNRYGHELDAEYVLLFPPIPRKRQQ